MLRLSEHYVSIQGEGPNTGIPTQFVRFAGCNLRCPGWPCDTPHAIEPSIWRKESEKIEASELFSRVVKLEESTGASNICLTGGEPFMQKEEDLKSFVTILRAAMLTVECFSNGTYLYPHWARFNMVIHMDWKLPGSGEYGKHEYERMQNARNLNSFGYGHTIKFVVKDETDLAQVEGTVVSLKHQGILLPLWIGAAWGWIEDKDLVEWILRRRLPLRLNVQQHKHIWDPEARRT